MTVTVTNNTLPNITDLRNTVNYREERTVKDADILTADVPAYIPDDISEDFFSYQLHRFPFILVNDDKSVLFRPRKLMVDGYRSLEIREQPFFLVDLEHFVLIQDYFLRKAKAKKKEENKKRRTWMKDAGLKPTNKRLSCIGKNKISYDHIPLFELFGYSFSYADNRKTFAEFHRQMQIVNDKMNDVSLQSMDDHNSYSKGQKTAYGDSNLSHALLKKFGVKVKRQNGDTIHINEIDELSAALTDVFTCYGDLSGLFRSYGLKLSHAGKKRMHARTAIGIFFPSFHAIGVSFNNMLSAGEILSHEIAHFLDSQKGKDHKRNNASDAPGLYRDIALTLKRNMNEKSKSKYTNRTCECFARALEQYFLYQKTDVVSSANDMCREAVFRDTLIPMIEKALAELHVPEFHAEHITDETSQPAAEIPPCTPKKSSDTDQLSLF